MFVCVRVLQYIYHLSQNVFKRVSACFRVCDCGFHCVSACLSACATEKDRN